MQLIESIEIGYFRSIYKEQINDLNNVTIFFGRNDSGKSNFLRALNLFFNNETNPGVPFNFHRDICHARLDEAAKKQDARKFISIKVFFRTPSSWRKSLGDKFYVKKSWSITKETEPNIESSIRDSQKQQYLTRFLNKIKFYYVPAIKDRKIFEKLLAEVYLVLAGHADFINSLGKFAAELKDKTSQLSVELLGTLGVQSVIAPPTALIDLFRSLDFETKGPQGDSYSLTLQRGDGVQVRHIPAILSFLSERGKEDFYIWGFEEPENSLELVNALKEAENFCKHGETSNKQIFVTSHSPAFFSLIKADVQRFFVSKKIVPPLTKETSVIRKIKSELFEDNPGDLMGELPHLSVISHYLKDADEKIRSIESQSKIFAAQIKRTQRPIVFVEGESDSLILDRAWKIFRPEPMPFEIKDSGGTSKMVGLACEGFTINYLAPDRKVFVVVDNDKAGRELHKDGHLKGVDNRGGRWVQNKANGVYWCRLFITNEMFQEMRGLNVQENLWPGCLENLFSKEVRRRAIEAGIYVMSNQLFDEIRADAGCYRAVTDYVASGEVEKRLYFYAPDKDCKIPFAKWICKEAESDPVILEPMRVVVNGLAKEIGL